MRESTLFLLALLVIQVLSQTNIFRALPTSIYSQTTASPQACLANCQSCQIQTNQCEQCLEPYFTKAQDGSCQLTQNYTLESSVNQLREGSAFIYTQQSWGTQPVTDCSPVQLTVPLRVIGPFDAGTNITYRRTLSFHSYFVVRFLLIAMDWNEQTNLTITLSDQDANIVDSKFVDNRTNIPQETLCSAQSVDRRISVEFRIADTRMTAIGVSFAFQSGGNGRWAIATWMLLTGQCDSTCSTCQFSNEAIRCIDCNSFLTKGSDERCSQCRTGFRLQTTNGINQCEKCPIQFDVCNPGRELCFYRDLNANLTNQCQFGAASNYNDNMYINSLEFPGTLFTLEGQPATYQCGEYSMVGLAQRGEIVTRIIATMPPHFLVSLTFNVFAVDQPANNPPTVFVIILDNLVLEASYLNLEGMSNLCGDSSLQSFVTYPATRFYPHTSQTNVNLTISGNSTNWAIRNVRFAYKICDQSCLQCGQSGCLECPGYVQLDGLRCSACPSGYGFVGTNSTQCEPCSENCLSCTLSTDGSSICTNCTAPYYLFENSCNLKTNIGEQEGIGIGGGANGGSGASSWNLTTPTSNSNGNNSNSSSGFTNTVCSLNGTAGNNGTQGIQFQVTEQRMNSSVSLPADHYKIIVQFYLLKVDTWQPGDRLDLYLNDLLVLSKNYSDFGNDICYNPNQTDYISFESIEIFDSNGTVTAAFETVGSAGNKFGVGGFKVYPIGCESCQNYAFSYKVDYTYDQYLWVHLQFNRVYQNPNNTLFKEIFTLFVDNQVMDYSVYRQDSVRYILEAAIDKDINSKVIRVECNHPQLVTTSTTDTVNDDGPFFDMRLMQAGNTPNPDYQTTKVIDNTRSQTTLQRYTPVEDQSSINGIRIVFQVVTRATIYLGLAMFLVGCQTICTHMMHNLQKIWVHMFVASLAIPSGFKFALVGFREVQNQNIAINPDGWEEGLPAPTYYDTPADYQQYYLDIGFFRNIYNIAIAFLIFIICFIIIRLILSRDSCAPNRGQDGIFIRHMRVTFVKRPFFYFNSIIFYQYLTLVLACTLQFLDITNRTNQGAYGGVSAAAAVIAFIIATIYPYIHLYYLIKKSRDFGDERRIEYANRYSQIFFRFLPWDVWIEGSQGITNGERVYNLLRFGELWFYAVVVTALHGSPQAQGFLLLVMNVAHLLLVLFSSLSYGLGFKLMKVLQLALFAGIEIILIVCDSQQDTLTQSSLGTLAGVGIALVFVLVVISLARVGYTAIRIYSEYNNNELKPAKDLNLKTRNQDYFESQFEGQDRLYSQPQ